ncbi:hypothetical protein JCM8547_002433 [Rhodosporidiobolus lusitaniae]
MDGALPWQLDPVLNGAPPGLNALSSPSTSTSTSTSHLQHPSQQPSAWPGQQQDGTQHLETGLSTEDFAWLEQQLSLAANPPPAEVDSFSTSPSAQQLPLGQSPPPGGIQGPHAFPPVSNARFHPYQLPSERPSRSKNGSAAAQNHLKLLPPHLQPPQRPPLGPSTSSTGPFDWPSFGAVASSFSPVPAPFPPQQLQQPLPPHLQQQILQHYQQQQQQQQQQLPFPAPGSAFPSTPHPAQPPPRVLYPPHDAPSPILLPDQSSPALPPAPHASPASVTSIPTPRPVSPPRTPRTRHHRSRSAPPPSLPPFPTPPAPSAPTVRFSSAAPPGRAGGAEEKKRDEERRRQLQELFDWLDEQRWSFSRLFTALSDVELVGSAGAGGEKKRPERTARVDVEHRRRMEEFLLLDGGDSAAVDEGTRRLKQARRRWALKKGEAELEKGPDEVVRMWEDLGGLGRRREGNMANAVQELHSNVHDGAVAGVAIRNIINRYGEAYNESASDIKRLDAALSRPPSPHLTSVPREAAVWTGVLVIPPTQSEVLQRWLVAPGRPAMQSEKGKIEPEHMRIYSSLSPLDLHARGAELCRVVLLHDADAMRLHGHNYDRLHTFSVGPVLAPIDTCGFSQFDDYSLFHHAVMVYLQLCVRYPQFREGKDATIVIHPDLPPPVHPTPLESLLVDRALHAHWDDLRLFLLNEHGGLLRSAVRAFSGVKLSKVDLLSVCDDTKAVMVALGKNKKNPNDRILPYDASISQIRNAWRNTAFWDPTAELVVWSAATTHFLELSALFPEFGLGVRDLPGLESLLGQTTVSSAPTLGQNGGTSPMAQ